MRSNIRYVVWCIVALGICLMGVGTVHAQHAGVEYENPNTAYALRYLEKATQFYRAEDYRNALDCVKIGQSFDNSCADLFYLEAVCLIQLGEIRAESVSAAEHAVASGLHRSMFDEQDAVLLLGRLYTETKRYREAVRLLEKVAVPSADRDYYHAAALYGLQQDEAARNMIATALTRWSFDVRFPKLFFLQERNKPVSRSGKKLADALIRQLHVWTAQDPSLAVFAAPFDPNPSENNRRLKVYRNMHRGHETHPDVRTALAAILAELRYGVIDEKTAVQEFFAVRSSDVLPVGGGRDVPACYSDQLVELCRFVGMRSVRQSIADRLHAFNGVILEDENNDGITDAAVFF